MVTPSDPFSPLISTDEQSQIDVTTIPGYFKHKYKFKVETVVDFVSKVRKASICDKFFSYNDLNYAGLQDLFADFHEAVKEKMIEDPLLKLKLNENRDEIADYVMFNLHAEFFYNQTPSKEEIIFKQKLDWMDRLDPNDPKIFGINYNENNAHTWKSAIKEVAKISEVYTPRAKLEQLKIAMDIVTLTL